MLNFINLIILIIGVFLVLALASGKLISLLKIPKVTGYLIVGLVIGSLDVSTLSYIFPNYDTISLSISGEDVKILDFFKILKEIGLGLIVFNIGGEFQLEHFKKLGKKVLWISSFEVLFTVTAVSILSAFVFLVFFDGLGVSIILYSVLIGVIAIETAPAATLLVLREYESEGPVTNHLLVLIGLNNIVCIIIFKIILSVFVSEAHSTLIPVLEVIVSIVIGVIIGIIISFIEKWLEKPVEILMLVIGGITLNIGIAYGVDQSIANYFPGVKFQISNLLANLFMGVALINSTTKGDTSFKALKNADLPIYAIFFVLAGASLHLHDFLESGFIIILFIILYVIGRSFGKIFGSLIGVKYAKLYPKLRNNLGFGLLTHAGVAIGLAYMIQDNLSGELGKTLSTVIFSAVVVFELTGPIFTRFAIIRSGEVKEISLSKKKYHTTKRSYQKVFVRLKHSLGFSKIKVLSKVGKIRCNDVMRSNVESILDSLPFDEVLKFASHCKYDQFPVVDNDHHFLGTISYSEIRDVLFDPEFAYLVIARDIMNEDPPIAYPNDSLKKLLVKFHTSEGDLDYLPVIDDHEPPHLIGMVTQKDVISAFRGIKQENEKKDF